MRPDTCGVLVAVKCSPCPLGQLAAAKITTQSSETYGSHARQRGASQLTHGSIASPQSHCKGKIFSLFIRESLAGVRLNEAALT